MLAVAAAVFIKIVHRQDAAGMAGLVAVVPDEEHQTVLLLIEHKQVLMLVLVCQGSGQLGEVQAAGDGTVQILKAAWAVQELLL